MSVTIYHNPRCSKSRATKALLDENNIAHETVLYLENPPTTDDLHGLLKALGLTSARDMMRTGEDIYKELRLDTVDDDEALCVAMSEHPRLIERPIVVKDGVARIGRPPESVLELF